jgi:GNAT superfamily N-acetyltransferase
MRMPVMTDELIEKLERVEIEFLRGRLRDSGGEPVVHLGEVVVVRRPGVPISDFNKVLGLSSRSVNRLDEILAHFDEHDGAVRFDVLAENLTDDVIAALEDRGFYAAGGLAVMYDTPAPTPLDASCDLEIIQVRTRDELREFVHRHQEGLEAPNAHRDFTGFMYWFGQPGWRLFTAYNDGVPASTAILYARDGVGFLAAAATIPSRRGRGGHLALLRHRITCARDMGCRLVWGQGEVGSASQRNMERAGLRLVGTKSVWTSRPQR